mmetsp:Transcript_1996/g.3097  ORF Transcript_1996/g.3097 Transcript_1996/m.3097 type:complete len:302 (+) Transcript_1996:54-959(+)
MMDAEEEYYIYTGGVVPPDVTRVRIDKSISVIPAQAFRGRPITELDCHIGVKKVEEFAFDGCPSLRLVIMPGVKEVKRRAFWKCGALTDVECGKLEIIKHGAFYNCEYLRSINLPSARGVEGYAFCDGEALTNVKFGKMLESISYGAFNGCYSLERIAIPLKDGVITDDDTFRECGNLKHVDLVEERGIRETIAALLLEEWKYDMAREMLSINQILPTTPAGDADDVDDVGGKARAVRMWIRSVLRKIIHYKAQHQRLLNEAASTLQFVVPQDIMVNNVLPFLELPSQMSEVEGHEEGRRR